MSAPRRLTSTPFLILPVWVFDATAGDCSTLRVYLTILNRGRMTRSAPRRLDWLITAAGVSRSTAYEALATLRASGALVESDDEWSLPSDPPSSTVPDSLSDQSDETSGRSDDALLLEGLETPEGSSTDVDATFDHFWTAWPSRNGKKLNKAKALGLWRRLSIDERRAAWRGAVNYAAASNAGAAGAMDAFRWLRDRLWDEWQTPAQISRSNGKGASQVRTRILGDDDRAMETGRVEW